MGCVSLSLSVYWLSERRAARFRFPSSFRLRGVQSPGRPRSQTGLPGTRPGVHTGDMMTGAAASTYDERIHPFAMQPALSQWLRGNGTGPG